MSINVVIRIRHAIYSIRTLLAFRHYIVAHHRVPIRRLITISIFSFPAGYVAHLEHIVCQYHKWMDICKHWIVINDVLLCFKIWHPDGENFSKI